MTNGKIIHIWGERGGGGRERDDYNIKKIAGDLSDTDENLLPIFVHKFAIRLMNISVKYETRSSSLHSSSRVLLELSLFYLFV